MNVTYKHFVFDIENPDRLHDGKNYLNVSITYHNEPLDPARITVDGDLTLLECKELISRLDPLISDFDSAWEIPQIINDGLQKYWANRN